MGGAFSSSKTSTSKPLQTPQSNQAFQGATGGAGNLAGAGGQYTGNALSMYNNLFGGRGTLTGMMDPSKLNVTSPAGPFAGAFTNDKNQLAEAAARNAANVRGQAAQSGFGAGSPSGMTARNLEANQQDLANNVGQAFTTETANSYNDALNNFWNATNLAARAANEQGNLGESSTDAAARIMQGLYGPSLGSTTTEKSNPSVMSDIGSAGSAGLQFATPVAGALRGKGSALNKGISGIGNSGIASQAGGLNSLMGK